MRSLCLSVLIALGAFGIATPNLKADDSILDGCLIGAFAGTIISVLTKGRPEKGAIAGCTVGAVSDAAYDDDLVERKIVGYHNGYPVYEVYTSTREGGKIYEGYERHTRTITTNRSVVHDSTRTPGEL